MDNMDLSNLEGMFYESMYRYGEVDPAWNREVLGFYVPFFAACPRVLDLGCGRGEFLELLREKGISGTGIDVDSEMIRICQEKGLEVIQADLFEYLATQEASWDGIFCSNVIEHLHADDVLRLFRLAHRALRSGGIFLVATPNPESLIVHLYEFWRDPTHVRLYNLPLLKFMMEYVGFRNVGGNGNPRTRWRPPWDEERLPNLRIRSLETHSLSKKRLYGLRRRIARFLIQQILFEEWNLVQGLIKSIELEKSLVQGLIESIELEKSLVQGLIESIGLKKSREIYVYGVKADE